MNMDNMDNKKTVMAVRYKKSMDRQGQKGVCYPSSRPPGGPISLHHSPPAPPPVATTNHDSHLYMISPVQADRTGHSSNNTSPVNTTNNVPQAPVVTLTGGRRRPRVKNEYVDTPQSKETLLPHTVGIHPGSGSVGGHRKSLQKSHTTNTQPQKVLLEPPICSQPKSLLKNNDKSGSGGDNTSTTHETSYVCPHCHRCKCDACTTPRELPKTWLGRDKCECSVQKVGEYCLCMCCVQCLFQTWFNDSEDQPSVADDPCSCGKPHCCQRWTCMVCLVPFLPGLLFYPCFKCGHVLCTSCYNRCTTPGCRCSSKKDTNKGHGNQRPLLDSESSST